MTGPYPTEDAFPYGEVFYDSPVTMWLLTDTYPPGAHPGFLALLDELRELHCKKGADYGTGTDPFANIRGSEAFGIPAWVGALVRANDKMVRLQAAAKGQNLVNESIEDSLLDLAAYALIALAIRREEG